MSKIQIPSAPFDPEVLAALRSPMVEKLVRQIEGGPRQGAPYLPIENAIKEANHCFGEGGWTREVLALAEISRNPAKTAAGRDAWLVSYMATVRVSAGGTHRDGVGVCESQPLPNLPAAIEFAAVGSVSMATKSALETFGARFGLFLDSARDPYGAGYFAERYGAAQGAPTNAPPAAPAPPAQPAPPSRPAPQSSPAAPVGPPSFPPPGAVAPPPTPPAAPSSQSGAGGGPPSYQGRRRELDGLLADYYGCFGTLPDEATRRGIYGPGDLAKVPDAMIETLIGEIRPLLG